MPPILITGADGFIGRPLVQRLRARGDAVHGLDLDFAAPVAGCKQHRDDLGSVERLERLLRKYGIGTVVHGAGVSGPLLARDDPHRIAQSNIYGSLNLLEAVRRTKAARLINLSSAAACGPTEGEVPDDADRRPADVYGASKAAVELMYAAHHDTLGVPAITLRMPTVYGPGSRMSCVIATMIAGALAGRRVELAWGRGYACPYLYIDDAVAAIVAAIDATVVSRSTYNIAGSEYVKIAMIKRLVERCIPRARISLGTGPPLPGYQRGRMDIRAARHDLGFSPQVGIEAGVAQCVAWLRGAALAGTRLA